MADIQEQIDGGSIMSAEVEKQIELMTPFIRECNARFEQFKDMSNNLISKAAFRIDDGEWEDNMHLVAMNMLKCKDADKLFKIGQTQMAKKSKVFLDEENKKIKIRPYRCRILQTPRFINSSGGLGYSTEEIKHIMPVNFVKACEEASEVLRDNHEKFKAMIETEDKKSYYSSTVKQKIDLAMIDNPGKMYVYEDDEYKLCEPELVDIYSQHQHYEPWFKIRMRTKMNGNDVDVTRASFMHPDSIRWLEVMKRGGEAWAEKQKEIKRTYEDKFEEILRKHGLLEHLMAEMI